MEIDKKQKEERNDGKKYRIVRKRTLKSDSKVVIVQPETGKKGVFVTAKQIVEIDPIPTRSYLGAKDKLASMHLYGSFDARIKLPISAVIERKPANKDLTERWQVKVSDTFIHCDISLNPVPGELLEARVDIKAKEIFDPLARGQKIMRYNYLNASPLEVGLKPEYEVVIDNAIDTSAPGFHFGGSDSKHDDIVHICEI